MTGDGSISEASAAGFTDYGGGPGQTTGSDTSASGGSDPFDYNSFYDQYQYAGSTPDPEGMSLEVENVLRDYQDRFGGSGDLAGLGSTFNTPIVGSVIDSLRGIPSAGMLAEDPVYGFREAVAAYPASVASSGTRSLADVVAGTPSTQSSTFDRPAYGDSSTAYRQAIDALSRMGYGTMEGANPNNPTQTVDQMIASNNVSNFLDKYAPTIFGAATGFGPHLNAIRMGADVLSGKATPGQVLTGLGLDYIAGKAGLPGGGPVLGDLLEGRVDRAASGATQRGLAALLGGALGIPAPIADIALKETGLGPSAGAAVANAVGPSQPTGATSSLAQLFDKGLGGLKEIFSGVPQAGAGTAGTAPTAQTGGVPYYGYASDSSPDSPATVAAPAAPAAPTTPEVQAAQRLLYGLAQGPYGPLLAYDIGGRG